MNRPLAPPGHCHSAVIEETARCLADQPVAPCRVVHVLQAFFDLTAKAGWETCALAKRYRMLRRAMA
jgi:hypothetical protein